MHAFEILGDPIRRRIVALLAEGERSAGDLGAVVQAEFGVSQPAVSLHLRVLRDGGFATVRTAGSRRLYTVLTTPMQAIDAWLERYRPLWTDRLDGATDTVVTRARERGLEAALTGRPHRGKKKKRKNRKGNHERRGADRG